MPKPFRARTAALLAFLSAALATAVAVLSWTVFILNTKGSDYGRPPALDHAFIQILMGVSVLWVAAWLLSIRLPAKPSPHFYAYQWLVLLMIFLYGMTPVFARAAAS